MKKMRKIFALLIAMVMVLGMSTMAFAAEDEEPSAPATGTITITLPTEKQAPTQATTYKIYKVFDATVDATDNTKVSYKLCSGDTLSADMTAAGFSVDGAGNVSFDGTMVATGDASDTVIKAIAGYVTEADVVDTVVSAVGDTTVTSKVLPYGYYYITTTSGTAVTIDTNNNTPTVQDKNIIPVVVKSAGTQYDAASKEAIAAVGTSQSYTAVITKTHGATNVVFKDTMTNQTYNGDVKVTVGGTEVAAGATTYSVSGAKGDATFTVTFVNDYIAGLADNTEITLNYSALITSDALSTNPATNTATLTSGNGNSVDSETIKTYNAKISVNKIDGDKKPLAGAKFKLKNADGKYYAGSTTDGEANWTADGIEVEAVAVTDESGAVVSYTANFMGLKDGTYTLEESTVPTGYNKAADSTVTIAAGNYTADNLEQTSEVTNNAGAELPSTGGIGTTIFYIIGAILVIGAGVVLVTRRRMNVQ